MPHQIPGFYYDEVKGKYFRVQADRQAVPGVRIHTKSSVKQTSQQLQDQHATRVLRSHITKKTIKRSPILKHPLSSRSLLRETGYATHDIVTDLGDTWASSTRSSSRISLLDLDGPTTLAYDHDSDVGIVGDGHGQVFLYRPKLESDIHSPCILRKRTSNGIFGNGITSLNLRGSHVFFTSYNTYGFFRIRPGSFPENTWERTSAASNMTYFSARLNPDASCLRMALATTSGIRMFHLDSKSIRGGLKTESHVMACDFRDPHVVAAGLRNGKVLMYDSRSAGSQARLCGPSGICNIFSIDENSLLVAASNNKMMMFDLRWHKEDCSRPVITYPNYVNSWNTRIGMDVSKELGLIATSGEDKKVRLHGLRDGRPIKYAWNERVWDSTIGCMEFANSDALAPALLLGRENKIETLEIDNDL